MAGLLAYPQSWLSGALPTNPLTPAEKRDTFASLREHVGAARKLLAIPEVSLALADPDSINPHGDPAVLFDALEIKRGIERIIHFEDIFTYLELFAAVQAGVYSGLTTRGRQTQSISVLRLVCAKNFLGIWQKYKGDPRGNRKATGRFYDFMGQAFDVIGHDLSGDELRVVQTKLRSAWGLPKKPNS